MESHEVLREAAEKVGVKALAAHLRLSPALVYKWCEESETDDPDASGTRNPLDRLRDIVQATGHIGVVGWLCQQAGGFFVHNPDAKSADIDTDLLQSTQQLVLGFSELLNEVSQSVANDGAITAGEARKIRREWEDLKTTAETFVVACERGVYRDPKR
ncbi:MAG TPA: helix-turn-helix domain-containing protein [Phycisphaerae bacterium]|nr:helix-turn-helix domain-containing protein [Phycisphaerae bacterium]